MTCCTFQNWLPSTWLRIPTSHNANRAVRNIALLHNTPLRGALGVDHVLTKYISIWFGNTSCKYRNPLKNLSSEFAPLHFIQATPRLVLSPLIGNFANKVACVSRIVSHPIAKSHLGQWENTTLHESDCFFRLFPNSWDWYETPAKNLKFFRGGRGFFGLILAAPLTTWQPWTNPLHENFLRTPLSTTTHYIGILTLENW